MKKHTYNFQPQKLAIPVEQVINNAIAYHRRGNLQQAEQFYSQALEMQPGNAFVINLLGVLHSQKGEHAEGEKLIKKAIKIDPDVADYHGNLGLCLQQQGRPEEAEKAYKKALQVDKKFVPALFGLGNVSLQLKKPGDAIDFFKKTIEIEPSHYPACNNLGNLYRELKDYDAALEMFERVLTIKPDFADAWYNIGTTYIVCENSQKAIEAFNKAIDLRPDYFRAHIKLGKCYSLLLNDSQSAIREYDRAIEINPRFIPAYLHKADAYHAIGQFDKGEETLRRALEVDDTSIDIYLKLIIGKKYNDADVQKIQATLDDDLDSKQLVDICFSLGKIFNDKKEYATAFNYYQQGNQCYRKTFHYDAGEFSEYISQIIEIFNPEFITRNTQYGLDTETPVFIIGMPRSGTTLTEQILVSHPKVYGGGESEYMNKLFLEFLRLLQEKSRDQSIESAKMLMRLEDIQPLAADYLKHLDQYNTNALRITDKTPGNYKSLGLIGMLFPRAKIIHCRRNPVDTCLSVYFQHFKELHPYAYDQEELGRHYRDYERLMVHWQDIFGERIFNLCYEEMISDQERISRQLVDFIGLDWDEQCLKFYETERSVKTWSQWQVRQKLYTDSVDRWRHYQFGLGPLIEALGDSVTISN